MGLDVGNSAWRAANVSATVHASTTTSTNDSGPLYCPFHSLHCSHWHCSLTDVPAWPTAVCSSATATTATVTVSQLVSSVACRFVPQPGYQPPVPSQVMSGNNAPPAYNQV